MWYLGGVCSGRDEDRPGATEEPDEFIKAAIDQMGYLVPFLTSDRGTYPGTYPKVRW